MIGIVMGGLLGLAAAGEAWIQVASIAPGERPGDARGFSAWLPASELEAQPRGDTREVTILRVMSPAQVEYEGAYRLIRLRFMCGAAQYVVISQAKYDRDGGDLGAVEGDGLVRTYAHNGLRPVADAVCNGVTPSGARVAASVIEAVAGPQYPAPSVP